MSINKTIIEYLTDAITYLDSLGKDSDNFVDSKREEIMIVRSKLLALKIYFIKGIEIIDKLRLNQYVKEDEASKELIRSNKQVLEELGIK